MNKQVIKVLIVDDSAVVRQALSTILDSDPEIEVMDVAADPYIAAKKMEKQAPDIITLDIEMPRMDGITFLQKIMQQHPLPVLICSSLTDSGSETAIQAMQAGAVDIITKPRMGAKQFLEESKVAICDAIKAVASADVGKVKKRSKNRSEAPPKSSPDAVCVGEPASRAMASTTEKIVVAGASTGGTEAIREFLEGMPLDGPGIVIVQHMPEQFTSAFAKRLDMLCAITVKEARDGDPILRGQALIAPGNYHLLVKRSGARYFVQVKGGPMVSRHRPSVDVLFRSASRYAGKNAIGIIMTGMGDDGATGMKELSDAGAYTLAQDEASSVIFGMPREAIQKGGVDKVTSLQGFVEEIMKVVK